MSPQYFCRRQCLVVLICIGSLMSLYILFTNKHVGPSKAKRLNYVHTHHHPRVKDKDSVEEIEVEETDVKVASVVNGPKKVAHVSGTLDGVGCKVRDIDPFSSDIMKYMHDFGEHVCAPTKTATIDVKLNTIHLVSTGLDFVRVRGVADHGDEDGFSFDDFVYLVRPTKTSPVLSKGKKGGVKNVASKRCIMPGRFDPDKPGDQIEVIYSERCEIPEAAFSYNKDGYLIHKMTKLCLGPKDGVKKPTQNTQIVISKHCNAKFDVINEGVLQLVGSGMCVHPLWGGDSPEEGQKLCLYPDCEAQKRLQFRWFYSYDKAAEEKITDKEFTLKNDMSHIQAQSLKDDVMNTYTLTIQPKPQPQIKVVSPNILIITIAEASAPHFKRKLPKTYKEMAKMGFMEFKYHAAVSPTASANMMATLYGHSSREGGTDESIFQLAKKHNYVTMFSADDPKNAGFRKDEGVDHLSLPLFRALQKKFNIAAQSFCVSGQPIYDLTFNYLLSFVNSYPAHPKLGTVLLSEISRVNFNYIGFMDNHFTSVLKQLHSYKNTIILLQTLRGGERGRLSQLVQGVEEIKRPLLATYVSEDIRDEYNFEVSRMSQLSTFYDTHVTVRELISSKEGEHKHGMSLLMKGEARNCNQAHVHPSMCPCV